MSRSLDSTHSVFSSSVELTMCNPFRWCCDDKKDKKKKKKNRKVAGGLQEPDYENSMITIEPQKSARISDMPSSPSGLKTQDLTDVYVIPSKDFQTVEEIVAAQGFEMGRDIGKGAYAVVYKARRLRDGQTVACKVMDISKSHQSATIKNELYALEMANHPHIIKLYKHFVVHSPKSRQVYIFMQMAEGKSLSDHMKRRVNGLDEATCRQMFVQIVSAVNHMHLKGLAHRDIKLGNVLLDNNGNCLVSDFGLSRVSLKKGDVVRSRKFCGTVLYMAPEILMVNEYGVDYDPFPPDIWALGVLLFYLINRDYPYHGDQGTILEQQLGHRFNFGTKKVFEPNNDLINMLRAMFDPTVEKRITMSDLVKHPWINNEMTLLEETITGKDKKGRVPTNKDGQETSNSKTDYSTNTSTPPLQTPSPAEQSSSGSQGNTPTEQAKPKRTPK